MDRPADASASGPDDGFSSLFDFLPIGVYRASPSGRLLRANAELARLNGYDDESQLLEAAGDIAFACDVDRGRREAFVQQLARDDAVVGFVSEIYRHRTRERCWVSENAHIVRDANGGALYLEGTVEDISGRIRERQALERSEAQFREIAERVPGMVYRNHVDHAGRRRFLYASQGARELLGVEPQALIDDSMLMQRMVHPDDRDSLLATLRASTRSGGAMAHEHRLLLADGSQKWVHVASNAVGRDDDGVLRVGLIIDISERKQADALRQERDRAELASQAKSALLGRVSHELRTPLNAVMGFAQLIAMDAALPPRPRAWAEQIRASGEHLLALVDDMLDLSSLHTGALHLSPEPVDLARSIARTWAMVAAGMPQPAVEFVDQFAGAPRVQADPRRLTQVLANLLGNAVKYNRAGGCVTVRARGAGGEVRLEVEDTGCGMDEAQLKRLFSPFDRLGAENGRVEGRGIGLALSRQLIDAMGGRIAVASRPGVGTTFSLWLPVAASGA